MFVLSTNSSRRYFFRPHGTLSNGRFFVVLMLMACGHGAQAFVTATSSSGSALPAVTVDAPAARQRPAASARRSVAATGARRAAARQGASATSSAQQAAAAAASRRTRTSDGTTGYVATRSSAGTKTDTP